MVRSDTWTHVVHACGSHGRRPKDELLRLHVATTQNLLDAISSNPVWINIGSAAQYGSHDPATEPRLHEEHPDKPVSPYGFSKLEQENLIRRAASRGLIRPIYLRVFNVIGPGQAGPFVMPYLIGQLMHAMVSGATRLTLDRWNAVRDYIDVRDVAGAVAAVVRCPLAIGHQLNVCSGHGTRLIELARQLSSAANRGITWDQGSSITETDEIPWQCGSPSKIHDLCGWRPSFPLPSTIADTWAAANAPGAATASDRHL